MRTLERRLSKLERHTVNAENQPQIVYLCDAETHEPAWAILVGRGNLERQPGESREAFELRAEEFPGDCPPGCR